MTIYLDQSPHAVTRAGACNVPYWAYRYARDIDRQPRDDTRAAASTDDKVAYIYARDVDKRPTPETARAACDDSEAWYKYRKHFSLDDELEIQILLGQPFDKGELAKCPSLRERYFDILIHDYWHV